MTKFDMSVIGFVIFLLSACILLLGGEIKKNEKSVERLELKIDSLATVIQQDTTRQRIDSLQTRLLHLETWNEIFAEYYPWIAKEIRTRQEQIRQDAEPAL